MKKALKFIVIGLAVFIAIGIFAGGNEESPANETTSADVKAETPKKEEKKSSVTKENYDKIKQGDSLTGKGGMSIEEVTAILGEPSDKMESSYDDGNGNTVNQVDYTWSTLDFESISVSFTNGHVSHKMWME